MEQRAAPAVTISGAPGPDTGTASYGDRDLPRTARPSIPGRVRFWLVPVTACVFGFATSQVVSDSDDRPSDRTSGGQLLLTVERTSGPDFITDAEGRLAVALSLDVRNTSSADIVVQSAAGGVLYDEAVAGRPVLAGGLVRVSLARRVDCAAARGDVLLGALAVTARTPAGTRRTELPMRADSEGQFTQLLQAACGQVPVESALELRAAALRYSQDTPARLPLSLRNLSASDILISGVRTTAGLSVELLDAAGAPIPLPLLLTAPDFTVPRPPAAGEQRLGVTAVFDVTGCARPGAAPGRALLELVVREASTGASTTVTYGDGEPVLDRLAPSDCR